ncbi:MAG: response regulator [Dehalococcoidia bacterium]
MANMSHELRTPLNAIIGFSEILADRTFGDLSEKQARYIDNIHSSGRHLLQLINDILDLSKVEAGHMRLDYSDVDVAAVMDGVLSTLRPLTDRKRISVTVRMADEVSTVFADEAKLRQIMLNLVSNATKFTPDEGAVRVTGEVVNPAPDGSSAGPCLRISVIDSGIGISPDDYTRIFEAFEQIDSSYARSQEGTGLGLALTRRLVELHGGRIWVESMGEGRGSTFSLDIPLAQEAPAPAEAGSPGEAPGEPQATRSTAPDGRTILVVDDDANSRELLAHYLTEASFHVAHAVDGDDALRKVREVRPDAIALDIMLPHKDGWAVLGELKSNPETNLIPVVIVSITSDKELGFSAGAADFLVKPVSRPRLLEVMNSLTPVTGSRPTVLVVDDDPNTVEITGEVLRGQGYKVIEAYGGREAIRLAGSEIPDAIILDLMMPEVCGLDVLSAIREQPETAQIPVVIFTAKSLSNDEVIELNERVQAVATKPAGRDALLRELERLGVFAHYRKHERPSRHGESLKVDQ